MWADDGDVDHDVECVSLLASPFPPSLPPSQHIDADSGDEQRAPQEQNHFSENGTSELFIARASRVNRKSVGFTFSPPFWTM